MGVSPRDRVFLLPATRAIERADVAYWLPSAVTRPRESDIPMRTIADLAVRIQYGLSTRATTEPVGVPMLRMNNLQDDDIVIDDLKYVVLESPVVEKYRLNQGDILVNRTNSKELVGKAATFGIPGEFVFASYLLRLEVDRSIADPEFVSLALNTAAREQINRVSRQIAGMSNINTVELRAISLPMPALTTQRRLAMPAIAARMAWHQSLAELRNTLAQRTSEVVESFLGIPSLARYQRREFAVPADLLPGQRLLPGIFHPDRVSAVSEIRKLPPTARARVGDLVRPVADRAHADSVRAYLGLANVESHTGEFVDGMRAEEATEGIAFQEGDLLYGRLRPYLNKVFLAERAGVCSPEFVVLRLRAGQDVHAGYLSVMLRSDLALRQVEHAMTGNTHPRITTDDVLAIEIPKPAPPVQQEIAEAVGELTRGLRDRAQGAKEQWRVTRAEFARRLADD